MDDDDEEALLAKNIISMMTTRTKASLRFCFLCTRKEGVKLFCEGIQQNKAVTR